MTSVLGIETSCDETAVAIVDNGRDVRCNLIATQFDRHTQYGGVVPEIASRAHIETLDGLVRKALEQTDRDHRQIDAIAVTQRPGLIGSLIIGVTAAKTLAWTWDCPLIGVNHIHAHATSAAIALDADPWPAVALVVSGGHTSLFHVRQFDDIELLGATLDDAAGEAFDKTASILELGYPGGPVIDRRARNGDQSAIRFPRTMLRPDSLDFSFSGLKTAVLYHVHGTGKTTGGLSRLTEHDVDDICASFSSAVVAVLVKKTMLAVARTGVDTVVVGGGVAANSMLRKRLTEECRERGLNLHLTPLAFCTDNAAMIAALGHQLLVRGCRSELDIAASANFGP